MLRVAATREILVAQDGGFHRVALRWTRTTIPIPPPERAYAAQTRAKVGSAIEEFWRGRYVVPAGHQLAGHGVKRDIAVLRQLAQHVECVRRIDFVPLHQHGLGLSDGVPRLHGGSHLAVERHASPGQCAERGVHRRDTA